MRLFTKPELEKQYGAVNDDSIEICNEYGRRKADHKSVFYSSNYNIMMTNEEPQSIKKYLIEFCLFLPHELPHELWISL